MPDDGFHHFLPAGDDRSLPSGLPPEAPLAMPPQVLERRRRRWRLFRR